MVGDMDGNEEGLNVSNGSVGPKLGLQVDFVGDIVGEGEGAFEGVRV